MHHELIGRTGLWFHGIYLQRRTPAGSIGSVGNPPQICTRAMLDWVFAFLGFGNRGLDGDRRPRQVSGRDDAVVGC